jgi:hypothetical protein
MMRTDPPAICVTESDTPQGEQEYRLIRQGVPGLCVLREKSIAHLHHP